MPAALIAQLVIALGPTAFTFIRDLVAVWGKESLTTEEVLSLCDRSQKSYEQYIADAKARTVSV